MNKLTILTLLALVSQSNSFAQNVESFDREYYQDIAKDYAEIGTAIGGNYLIFKALLQKENNFWWKVIPDEMMSVESAALNVKIAKGALTSIQDEIFKLKMQLFEPNHDLEKLHAEISSSEKQFDVLTKNLADARAEYKSVEAQLQKTMKDLYCGELSSTIKGKLVRSTLSKYVIIRGVSMAAGALLLIDTANRIYSVISGKTAAGPASIDFDHSIDDNGILKKLFK